MKRFLNHWNFWRKHLVSRMNSSSDFFPSEEISTAEQQAINYWCQLHQPFQLSEASTIQDIPLLRKTGYSYDFHAIFSTLPRHWRFHCKFGDNVENPEAPTFVKSRPIHQPNENAILLPLNTSRHLQFAKDRLSFEDKKAGIVWRGSCFQPLRARFLEEFFDSEFCDVGNTSSRSPQVQFSKPEMSVSQQLRHKFIFSIEGNDVATNLKWIMSSNSVCIMPRPRYETWFMEGKLQPEVHYIEVRDDFSDLEEKYQYYLAQPQRCREITANANEYASQFKDISHQHLVARHVVRRYVELSGQI